MNTVLSTAYWPNLHYLYYVLNASSVLIDLQEYYEKQSYRNRCTILSANGPLDLSIPVHRLHNKCTSASVLLSTETPWRQQHCHAIRSAYGKSPYFDYFAPDIFALYEQPFQVLADFNAAQLTLLLKILRLKKEIVYSSVYVEDQAALDLRQGIHPKIGYETDQTVHSCLSQPYYQTFGARYPFCANLSSLDLLFNKGLDARLYLSGPKN